MRPASLRHLTYALSFIVALHVALVSYINSSALSRFFAESTVSIIYTVGFAIATLALLIAPRFLQKMGDVRMTALFLSLEILALFGLALSSSPKVFLLAFFAHLILPQLLAVDLDIFLEHATRHERMGRTRGIFLTALNAAFVIAPGIAGWLLGGGDAYTTVYLVSGIVLIPALIIVLASFRRFSDPRYHIPRLKEGLRVVWRKASLRRAFLSNFLLRFFYAVMVIYTPLHLHETVGLPWSSIGIIFTIMLLPFVLFELPLGKLADSRFGEKEILALGFAVMGLSTIALSFISTPSVVLWAGLLFLTRTGASMVESMTEIYFFKTVSDTDAEIMSLFRVVEPFAYIVTPLLVAALLPILSMPSLFAVIGITCLSGIPIALALKDTR